MRLFLAALLTCEAAHDGLNLDDQRYAYAPLCVVCFQSYLKISRCASSTMIFSTRCSVVRHFKAWLARLARNATLPSLDLT